MRRATLTAVSALALALTACAFEPATDERLQPTDEYPGWWQAVEACSQQTGDYRRIEWYVLQPADMTHGVAEGYHLGGYTVGSRVWIAAAYVSNRLIVQHEMLHVLIGDGNHSRPEWAMCGIPTEG